MAEEAVLDYARNNAVHYRKDRSAVNHPHELLTRKNILAPSTEAPTSKKLGASIATKSQAVLRQMVHLPVQQFQKDKIGYPHSSRNKFLTLAFHLCLVPPPVNRHGCL